MILKPTNRCYEIERPTNRVHKIGKPTNKGHEIGRPTNGGLEIGRPMNGGHENDSSKRIMVQDLRKEKTDWDQPVSQAIYNVWQKWREELHLLQEHLIPRNYNPKNIEVASVELHGFSNASELVYTRMVYLLMNYACLCGAMVVAKLLRRGQRMFDIPNASTFAWTESTIVLSCL